MVTEVAEKPLSFDAYLQHADGSDQRHELVDGRLISMPPPTFRHLLIAKYLEQLLDREIRRLGLPWLCLREAGLRTGVRKSRLMDLCVVSDAQVRETLHRSAVFDAPPLLAVEVVSEESVKRDYRYKRSEYAAVEVPEYWIVDPLRERVTVLVLEEGLYEESVFAGDDSVVSPLFAELTVPAGALLNPASTTTP